MGDRMQRAQQRIAELKAEHVRLQAEIGTLEQTIAEQDSALQAAYAFVERGGPADAKAIAKSEAELEGLRAQLRRKRAAIEACRGDLASAEAELKAVERQETFERVRDTLTTMKNVADELDKNPVQPALWGELARLNGLAGRLLQSIGINGAQHGLLGNPITVRDRLARYFVDMTEVAIARPPRAPMPPAPSVRQYMNLDRTEARLCEMFAVAPQGKGDGAASQS